MWGQRWGQMLWGSPAAVPALSGGALLLLSVVMLVLGYRLAKRERAPRWLPWMAGLGAALLPMAIVQAATFTVPFIFTNGTVADATQVNQNFAPVATAIDKLRKPVSVVNECQFQTRDSSYGRSCAFGQGGASITTGNDIALIAPLQIPMGAMISSVEVWVDDSNPDANISMCLVGMFNSTGAFEFGVPCATTSGTPGITKVTIGFAPFAQGSDRAYELWAITKNNAGDFINWPTGFNLQVRTAYVHYETP